MLSIGLHPIPQWEKQPFTAVSACLRALAWVALDDRDVVQTVLRSTPIKDVRDPPLLFDGDVRALLQFAQGRAAGRGGRATAACSRRRG